MLNVLRPGMYFSQEEFLTKNFHPGLFSFYTEELGFSPEEMKQEKAIWLDTVAGTIPPFFPGMPELIRRQKAAGGWVCVVSHSYEKYIRRDYRAAGVPEPDLIYGLEEDLTRCKPYPYPLMEIMRITGCSADDLLMVDDLKPGMDMAHACGVKFAACCWSYEIPAIRDQMRKNADHYLKTIAELEQLLFPGDPL